MNTNKPKEKMITLKEAAKISGYAPDYIGQLIRKGRLPGRQVYCTVAWMTTEEAMRNYIAKNKNGERDLTLKEKIITRLQEYRSRVALEMKFARLVTTALYLAIILSIGSLFVLFYIFSVSVDRKVQENARQKLEPQILNPL